MKTELMHNVVVLLLANVLFLACTSGGNQKEEVATNSSSTTATLSADTLAELTASSTPTSTSGQNYTFAAASHELQIVGADNQYDILLPTDVLFDFDKADIRPEGLTLLQKAKTHFATHGVDQLHVWGHTDAKGEDQYNFRLSQRRAIAVANWLKKNVKTKGLIMAVGRGEQEPLAPNQHPDGTDNPVNRQKNRRVTLSVVNYPNAGKMLEDAKKQAAQ